MKEITAFLETLGKTIEMHCIHRLQYIEVLDAFDIVILALLFYFIVNFIIDKRGMRLIIGLLLLLVVLVFAMIFHWEGILLVFQNFYQYGFIGIFIMFQPELRSALEKIGNAPMANLKQISGADHKSSQFLTNSVSIIAETAHELSLEKTGALIVIERETKLGEYVTTGTLINAQLTSQLLKNLFFNKAPLHDGAVILRNLRIYSAGCILPLSSNDELDLNLGTRHRAAIGITEMSDAVSVIVSEETGTISIAYDGKIKRNLTQKTLKKELSRILIPSNPTKTNKVKNNDTEEFEAKEESNT